jgi:hypothetical protein
VSVKQLAAYRPLTLTSSLTTSSGADFEADSMWNGGTLSGSILIGSATTVKVSGPVKLMDPVTVSNAGTVQLLDGGSVTVSGGMTPSWLNSGSVVFADSSGASMTVGRFLNLSSGVVSKTGTAAVDTVNGYTQLENDGTVTSSNGVLSWGASAGASTAAPGNGISDGLYSTTGSGHVDLTANTTVSTSATYAGGAVWVTGTMAGTVNLAAGVTLNVGDDPATSSVEVGTITAPVQGAGTLNVTSGGTVAADLNNATVLMRNATLSPKADKTPTQIGSGTTVTMSTTPSLVAGLALVSGGTMDFGTNDYFNCSTCAIANKGIFIVSNPDSSFAHTFNITTGTFDNTGLIMETGYYPGVNITFGPSATVVHKGNAEVHNMAQPTWIQKLRDSSTVQTLASSVDLARLAASPSLAASAYLSNMGVGNCANANVSLGIAGASAGVCLVVAPDGTEVVAITVAWSVGPSVEKTSSGWELGKVFQGAKFTMDAGSYALWRSGGAGNQSFDATTDIDGPFLCENGTVAYEAGLTGQHCWGPADSVPFSLEVSYPITSPGIHTGYIGAAVGDGFSASLTSSYSVVITCGQWHDITLKTCPPANTTPPVIAGTAAVGQTLSASPGTWTTTPTSYTYQWQRCSSSSPTSCSVISGANTSQYVIVDADKRNYLTVVVTATNAGGSVSTKPNPQTYIP